MIMPTRKARRQPRSGVPRESTPPIMPLIPAIRPQNRINIQAAQPINTPPKKLRNGVNCTRLMVMVNTFCVIFRTVKLIEGIEQYQHIRIINAVENLFPLAACRHELQASHHPQLL
ncbi:hypothetical protein WP5W18E06_P11350 (plasmid) [Klebsiella quasipneumoniae]|nr:hypothetical protein WP5W18E06_P11350 [Klebsiella quasipneumoniae]CAH1460005.1 Uncharacterised protein [Klebsiella quasipneumoniae]CAH1480755.1 Uncharacterised protein [Klebsiella quasipneumoniae]